MPVKLSPRLTHVCKFILLETSVEYPRVKSVRRKKAEKKNSSKLVFDDQIWYSPEYIKKKTQYTTTVEKQRHIRKSTAA